MNEPFTSVVIPVFGRTENLKQTLLSLGDDVLANGNAEVIIAAFRPSKQLTDIVLGTPCACCIEVVEVDGECWNVARARNVGIRTTKGDVVVLLDADLCVCRGFLQRHREMHLTGRALGVGAATSFAPYGSGICSSIDEFAGTDSVAALDERWQFNVREIPLPWAFCWSGNISVPGALARRTEYLFDEDFVGWGAEDLEWAFRLFEGGAKPLFDQAAVAYHQPHPRDVPTNCREERANMVRFLRKHPCLAVEVVVRYNDLEGNRRFSAIADEIAGYTYRAIVLEEGNVRKCYLGGGAGGEQPAGQHIMSVPLLGLATFFEEDEFDVVELSPWLCSLSEELLTDVRREACRIGRCVLATDMSG
jgi:hypothetical protein